MSSRTLLRLFILAILTLSISIPAFAGANIIIVNLDGPNEGFNDPTPAAPVGGNPGTTKGQQRLIAFQHAADIWGRTLDSNQTIRVQAAFNPLGTNVLGSAGATFIFRDFAGAGLYPGPEFPATWYGSALADRRAGTELNPNFNDINSQFSSNFDFYLGLDSNHGAQVDLVVVLLHELGHGLNFQNFVTEQTGANSGISATSPAGFTDIYARHTFDISTGEFWDQMTQAERQASAINFGRVVWDGANVTAGVPEVLLFGSPEVRMLTPAAIAGPYQFGTAAFGPPITTMLSQVTGSVVAALDAADAAGPATTDGCSALTNASAVAGNIALIERGTCGFVLKAKIAQDAGARAVIIYNNVANAAAGAPGMAGVDPTVIIPSVSLSRTDGLTVIAQLPNVTGSIGKDPSIRAGADPFGRARLFMPNPVQGGSSGSHYDSIAFKNLLMEPAINGDLTQSLTPPEDLTLALMRDVGWFKDSDLDGLGDDVETCDVSNFQPQVTIDGCNTEVANTLFNTGCTVSDLIARCADGASNHGEFVSCVAHLANSLRDNGAISNNDKASIQSCSARSTHP
jgi:hypothetical protein